MAFDPGKKFVRVTELREDGFVEFDFAVGEPEIFVEMILPAAAFDDFCAHNRVTFLDRDGHVTVGDNPMDWRMRDAVRRGTGSPTAAK